MIHFMDLFSLALSLPLLVRPAQLHTTYAMPSEVRADATISTGTLTWPAGWYREDGVLSVGTTQEL